MPRQNEPQAKKNVNAKGEEFIRVRWKGQTYSCGPWDDPASWRRFEELKDDLLRGPTAVLTITDLVAAYWKFAQTYYRHAAGDPTSEQRSIKANLDSLLESHARTPVREFDQVALKAHRKRLIDAGLSRKSINQEIGRVVRMFKWGAEEPMIETEIWYRLAAVGGLKEGRSEAPDLSKVRAVDWANVEAMISYLPPPLQAAVHMQRWAICCRPDEALRLRPCDIDRSGEIWIYRPTCPVTGKPRHKTAWRNKPKVVLIGPELQKILAPWLEGIEAEEYCFSPERETARRREEKRKLRKSKVQPSQRCRAKTNPKKRPGDKYTVSSYAHAIEKAIAAANLDLACAKCKALGYPPACSKCVDEEGKPRPINRRCVDCRDRTFLWCFDCRAKLVLHWAPNQLRHFRLTELERRFGIRDAQRAAGHSSPSTTEIYLEEDLDELTKIAKEVG